VNFTRRDVECALCGTYSGGSNLLYRVQSARGNSWDLTPLLRQCLHFLSLGDAAVGGTASLSIPECLVGEPAAWAASSLTLGNQTDAGTRTVWLRDWSPDWLGDDGRTAVDDAVAERLSVERQPLILADPLVPARTNRAWTEARSLGQREAVRSVMFAPPGSTTLVVLPTGVGKSLVFQFAARQLYDSHGTVVVIVPTVALALDQAERFRELLSAEERERYRDVPFAYAASLTAGEQTRFRTELRAGGLPIAFLSPEAALGSQLSALIYANRQGRIAMLAVDETHIVAQWGEGFRPHFQSLGALRDKFVDEAPGAKPRTVLLTATLTEDSYDVLRDVFGDTLRVVSEIWLREEPRPIMRHCSTRDEQTQRVKDALHHLPRPLVLYTTKRKDAKRWCDILKGAEFKLSRVCRIMGGDLSDAAGRGLLDDWKNGKIDIVVATSAFGLGVDNAGVRSVVHACVPETVDRWYQEVGRGGRDGRASLALMLWTDPDLATANKIASDAVASTPRAFERWTTMWVKRESAAEGSYQLNLSLRPDDIHADSDLNRSWNYRVLAMMTRANILKFAVLDPSDEGTAPAEAPHDVDSPRPPTVVVRIEKESPTRNQDEFARLFEPVRRVRYDRAKRQTEQVRSLIGSAHTAKGLLSSIYSIPSLDITCATRRDLAYPVVKHCDPQYVWPRCLKPLVFKNFPHQLWVQYSEDTAAAFDWGVRVQNVLRALAQLGFTEFNVPREFECWERWGPISPVQFAMRRQTDTVVWRAGACTYLPASVDAEAVKLAAACQASVHVILVSAKAPYWGNATESVASHRPTVSWRQLELVTENS
jgi:ATP-dependent DNA helicase RecQ